MSFHLQLAAAQQENLYYAYTMPPEMTMAPVTVDAVPVECVPATGGEIFPPLPSVIGASKVDPHSVAKRLQDRYDLMFSYIKDNFVFS